MADNYLEKRMEELRSGKLAVKHAIPGINRKSPRVLVAGGCYGTAREKAIEFRSQGYRVAVFDSDEISGKRMAHDHGIRFHRVALTDESSLRREIHSLLSVWRGVDILVGTNEIYRLFDNIIRIWKENLPIPDKSVLEIVIL